MPGIRSSAREAEAEREIAMAREVNKPERVYIVMRDGLRVSEKLYTRNSEAGFACRVWGGTGATVAAFDLVPVRKGGKAK